MFQVYWCFYPYTRANMAQPHWQKLWIRYKKSKHLSEVGFDWHSTCMICFYAKGNDSCLINFQIVWDGVGEIVYS
jgi:hypothetical protein